VILITQHDFYIKFGTHQWMRQDTVYLWQGPRLKLLARYAATRIPGQPPPALVGVQCGNVPAVAPAADPPVPGPGLASVSFVSSGTAFVLGSAPCAHAPCTIVLRTLDGGSSWGRLSAPAEAISVPDGKGLWGLRFADARHGYAYGAGLWTTGDGAASWQTMKAPGRTVLAFAAVRDRDRNLLRPRDRGGRCLHDELPRGERQLDDDRPRTGRRCQAEGSNNRDEDAPQH
jgi:hypothetical protein